MTREKESLISLISALNENPANPDEKSADIFMAFGPTAPAKISGPFLECVLGPISE